MTLDEMHEALAWCTYPGYSITVTVDGRGAWYLQGRYMEADVVTGKSEMQYTRRWFLSPEMTNSEVVQTAFKCVLTSVEHRAREHFLYKDKAIFGPYYDVEALWEIAEDRDVRE